MRRVGILLAWLCLAGWSAGTTIAATHGGTTTAGTDVRLEAPALFAATPETELQIASNTQYVVQPANSRIRITVDATISNTHRDTPPVRSYFDTGYLAVLPGATNLAVTSPGAKPTVSVRSQTNTYTLLAIKFGRRLYGGHHTPLRLTFNLPDTGGTAVRDVRIGESLIAFPAWAFATTGATGGSVTVVFPPGYNVQVLAGTVRGPSGGTGNTTVYRSGTLADPLSFYAYFVADRPGAFRETSVVVDVAGTQVPVRIRGWADDPGWVTRVSSLLRRGLPALGTAIGLAYGGQGLVVEEAVSRTIGGYAGLYDPVAATIDVAYYADSFVVLHEAAHAWFNGRMVSDRWISEGFASWYAAQAATALKITAAPPGLTKELQAARIPLNAWAGVGRADEATEDYAYAATYQLAGLIAKRAGATGLHAVWEAAVTGEQAYQPLQATSAPEAGATPPDWRGLLDLLEERTDATYADLWSSWVVRPQEAPMLAIRAQARTDYAAAVTAAGDWELPAAISSGDVGVAVRPCRGTDQRSPGSPPAARRDRRGGIRGGPDAAGHASLHVRRRRRAGSGLARLRWSSRPSTRSWLRRPRRAGRSTSSSRSACWAWSRRSRWSPRAARSRPGTWRPRRPTPPRRRPSGIQPAAGGSSASSACSC